MQQWPRVSIVTPSYNQGRYIGETIESVQAQEYPNLEHIVIDGGSTDETLDVLSKYTHLRVVSERDHGQADAINKGFARATGDIWGFLNSDDTFLPGALQRVAREIDPGKGRHVVMGRCRFIDEDSHYRGIEHPSYFQNHQRVLAIWKGHGIPQPAVFWTPEVWHKCGPMRLDLKYHLDYDLFCRFSRRYRFHSIDQVLATYRLHSESKTNEWGEAERLEDSIRISRQYWGSVFSPLHWQLTLSLGWYRFDRVGRSNRLLYRAMSLRHKQLPLAVATAAASAALAPEVAFFTIAYPRLRMRAGRNFNKLLALLARKDRVAPQTLVYFDHTDVWPDGWAGPRLVHTIKTSTVARVIRIAGDSPRPFFRRAQVLSIAVDGSPVGQRRVERDGTFDLMLPLPNPLAPGTHNVEVRSTEWYVGNDYVPLRDYRPLAWRVRDLSLTA